MKWERAKPTKPSKAGLMKKAQELSQKYRTEALQLEAMKNSLHHLGVSKVEQMETELRKLSQAEIRQIREWAGRFARR